MMTKLLAGAIGQPQDDDEVARVMQKLRDEERAAAEAEMAEALAKGIPACLLELDALPAEELRAIFKAAFEKFDAEDAARLAPRGAAPTTEPAPNASTADEFREAYRLTEMIQHVPMGDVIDSIEFAKALKFFVLAASGKNPAPKSYAQVGAAIREAGFQPAQCIPTRITEIYWEEQHAQRRQTAWRTFLNMVKLWSKVCCKGLECRHVSSTRHLLANALSGFEFDHLYPEDKNDKNDTIHDMFVRHGHTDVNRAVAALRDSAVTCRSCHDKGHKAGGTDVGKHT
jgi:hypothetical protein